MKNKILPLILILLLLTPLAHAQKAKKSGNINSIVALSERLERENDPNYGDMYSRLK